MLAQPASAQETVSASPDRDVTGLTLELAYTGDLQTVARGGIRPGTRYLDLLEGAVQERITLKENTYVTFRGMIGARAARPLLNDELLGSVQPSSSVDDLPGVRLIEAWAEIGQVDGPSLRLGTQEVDADFATLRANEFFVNDAHQLGPDILFSGEGEAPSFPAARLGARVLLPVGSTIFKAAVFDAVPTYGTDARRPDFHISDREGAFVIGEAEYRFASGARIGGGAWGYAWQWSVIVDGTRIVCEAIAARGGRAVIASSIAVYGTRIQTGPCQEDDPHGPWAGAYGRAKQGQEDVARDISAHTGMPLTIVRPANVYGVGGASAWGDRLIAAIAATGGAVFGGAERNQAGLVYVANLADALFLAGTAPQAIGQTYNVCDENGVTWRRFVDDMAAIAGKPPPPVIPLEAALAHVQANENPADLIEPKDTGTLSMEGLNLVGFSNRIDSSRIRNQLGWLPRIGYAEAVASIARDYQRVLTAT